MGNWKIENDKKEVYTSDKQLREGKELAPVAQRVTMLSTP